jgi:hypothetical protein
MERFPLVQIEQRKASKDPKNGFSKKVETERILQVFGILKTKRHNLKKTLFRK